MVGFGFDMNNGGGYDVMMLRNECHTVQCIVYIVQCTLYNIHCTLYTVHCTVYSVYCTAYSVHTLYCVLYTKQST